MSDEQTKLAHENWIEGIDPRLEVMNAVPLVLSTPVHLLAENRITDKNYLFVRNIQDLVKGMTMEPVPLDGWTIELTGLIRPFRVVIRAEDLLLSTEPPANKPGQQPARIENLALDAVILNHVQYVLEINHGNKLRAARQLGISRSTLSRILGHDSVAAQ